MEKENNRSGEDFAHATSGFSRRDATPQTQDTSKSSSSFIAMGEHLTGAATTCTSVTSTAAHQKATGDYAFGGISAGSNPAVASLVGRFASLTADPSMSAIF